jgi:hypothetical protein
LFLLENKLFQVIIKFLPDSGAKQQKIKKSLQDAFFSRRCQGAGVGFQLAGKAIL